jgi:hypothetical protein
MERDRRFADDVGIRDLKFALTGIGIACAIAILLAILA